MLQDRYEEAASEFEAALQINPKHYHAAYYHARAAFAHGEIERSAELFRRAGKKDWLHEELLWFDCGMSERSPLRGLPAEMLLRLILLQRTAQATGAVKASEEAFPGGADTVIIATGLNWPDALAGGASSSTLHAANTNNIDAMISTATSLMISSYLLCTTDSNKFSIPMNRHQFIG